MSKFSPKFKRKIATILPFGIIWLVNSWLLLFVEYAAVSVLDAKNLPPEFIISLSPKIFVFASFSVFFIGCFVGFLEVSLINRFFSRYTFIQKLLGKFLIYLLFFFAINFTFYMLAASIEMEQSLINQQVFNRFLVYFYSITNLSTFVQLSFSLLVSLIYSEIEDNLGQAVFLNFFTGKYHKPLEEQRIFMFTDMKDSTSIAETMGHIRYFDFLRDYYNDLSRAIINSYGEVYQYIGDEIVISWDLMRQEAAEHAVACFFEMKQDLQKKRAWYLDHYGIFPDFKGALHSGKVTTGEIGALKKEIFFTGDVLNTTARMQGLCRKYQTDLLISKELVDSLNNTSGYNLEHVGQTKLKGKKESVEFYSMRMDETHTQMQL